MSDYDMSLFHVLTNSFSLNEAYDCPENETEKVFERKLLGWYFLTSGSVLISLYIPCFLVMYKAAAHTPIFHIMMMLAICDMISLFVNSVATGFLDLIGATFCHYPLLIFVTGAIGTGCWMGGCAACILLAVDRCVEANPKFFLAFLFGKRIFRFVFIVMIGYWIYAVFFTKPLLFTSEFSSWFFDPKIGKNPELYHSIAHTINNLLVSAAITILYMYLCIYLLYKKTNTVSSMWVVRSKNQIIIQAVILCSFHAAAAYIYVYMQFFSSPPILILLGQLTWQWSNGCFAIVYLTINRTIRNSVLQMMFNKKFRSTFGLYVAPDEQTPGFVDGKIVEGTLMSTAKLYSLCLIAMFTSGNATHPAYKIMISLAFFDILQVFINSIATGYFALQGTYFCEHSKLIFFLGANGFGLWAGSSICCVLLAICRIAELNPILNMDRLFKTGWMNVLLLVIFLYPFCSTCFTKPILFRHEYLSWFFDPGLGLEPSNYSNFMMLFNNASVSVIAIILYAYLTAFLLTKGRANNSEEFSNAQKSFILQAAIICFFHSVNSMLYVYMQFFYSPLWLMVYTSFGWQICTGCVSVVYLTLNRSLRHAVGRLICPKGCRKNNTVSYTDGVV